MIIPCDELPSHAPERFYSAGLFPITFYFVFPAFLSSLTDQQCDSPCLQEIVLQAAPVSAMLEKIHRPNPPVGLMRNSACAQIVPWQVINVAWPGSTLSIFAIQHNDLTKQSPLPGTARIGSPNKMRRLDARCQMIPDTVAKICPH